MSRRIRLGEADAVAEARPAQRQARAVSSISAEMSIPWKIDRG